MCWLCVAYWVDFHNFGMVTFSRKPLLRIFTNFTNCRLGCVCVLVVRSHNTYFLSWSRVVISPPYPMPPPQATKEPEALTPMTATTDQLVLPEQHQKNLPGLDLTMVSNPQVPSSLPIPDCKPSDLPMKVDSPELPPIMDPLPLPMPPDALSCSGYISPSLVCPHAEAPESQPSPPPVSSLVWKPSPQPSGSVVYVSKLSELTLDVLDGHSYTPPPYEGIITGNLGNLLYYRFRTLDHPSLLWISHIPVDSVLGAWCALLSVVTACNVRKVSAPPIMYFLSLLLKSQVLLKDIPMDLWDLSPDSLEPLDEVQSFIHIVNMNINISTPYILWPQGLHATHDCSWILSISAPSALWCLCCSLGPHTVDIVHDLVSHRIPFWTFANFERLDVDVQLPISPFSPCPIALLLTPNPTIPHCK